MGIKAVCDCGCGCELAEHDAGRVPMIYRSQGGIVLEVRVLSGQGFEVPVVRAGCVRKMIEGAELLFPRIPQLVDPAAEEGEAA